MGGDSMNWVQTLPTPRLFRVNLDEYQEDIDWVKKALANLGYTVATARLDPYVEVWFFYERDGGFVLALDHELIESLMEYRLNAGHSRHDARVQTRNTAERVEARTNSDESQTSDCHRPSPGWPGWSQLGWLGKDDDDSPECP